MTLFLRSVAMLLALAAAATLHPAAAHAAADLPGSATFSVTVEGEGTDVIMIPGLTSGRRVWDGAVATLAGGHRVHRLQIAGFAGEPSGGNAEGPVLDAVVEELHAYIAAQRLERPAVVGHSVGGLIGLMLAARHPGDVDRLLVVDALPFYGLLFDPAATVETVAPRAARLRDHLLGMDEAAYRAQQQQTMLALVRNEAARPAVLADSLASDRSVVARALYEDMITDMRPALPTIAARTTIAYAVNAFATEETFGRAVRTGFAALPGVRFEPVTDSHHFIMLDQPARFAEILAVFLADTAAR